MISRSCRRSCIQSSLGALSVVFVFYVMVSLSLHQLDMTTHRLVIQAASSHRHNRRGGKHSISVDYRNQDEDGDVIFPDQDSGENQETEHRRYSQEVENTPNSKEVTQPNTDPKNYANPSTEKFCNSFIKYLKKRGKHFISHDDESFAVFVERLKKRQKKGKRLFSPKKDGKNDPPWRQFYRGIWQYGLYDTSTDVVKELLNELHNQPVKSVVDRDGGRQMALLLMLKDGTRALLKPMRTPREQETLPDHFYFNDFQRHNADIAAFHLDRVLGFHRVPPTVGRKFNIELDFNDFENTTLEDNCYISPANNKCFFGKCREYCDSNHPVCGKPDEFEASLTIWLPGKGKALRKKEQNPWKRSHSTSWIAPWEHDGEFCAKVKQDKLYGTGRRLLDIMDVHVFDFLTGNMDRHSIEFFQIFSTDTFPILFNNGQGFGKSKEDETTILAPIRQCCQIRLSTLAKLVKLYTGSEKLSSLMRSSLAEDPLDPILTDPHLDAFDRRVVHILTVVNECVDKSRSFKKVVIDDSHM